MRIICCFCWYDLTFFITANRDNNEQTSKLLEKKASTELQHNSELTATVTHSV